MSVTQGRLPPLPKPCIIILIGSELFKRDSLSAVSFVISIMSLTLAILSPLLWPLPALAYKDNWLAEVDNCAEAEPVGPPGLFVAAVAVATVGVTIVWLEC